MAIVRILGLLAVAPLLAAQTPPRTLDVIIAHETAPAGAMVQIKVSLAAPRSILNGRLSMSLDPAMFGDIASVAVLSAFGDASGDAEIQGRRVSLRFSSAAGGVGRMAGLPVAVVKAPLLASVRPGQFFAVNVESSAPWKDAQGGEFQLAVQHGRVTVGGTLAIRSVTPRADTLAAGSALTVEGSGFTSATTAEIEGVPIAAIRFENATRMRVELAGPAVLTGKRLRIRQGSESVDYFLTQQPTPPANAPAWLPAGFVPLLPLQASTGWGGPGGFGSSGSVRFGILLQNPHPAPVEVTIRGIGPRGIVLNATTRTVAGGQTAVFDVADITTGFSTRISAPVPIRAASLGLLPGEGVSLAPAFPQSIGPAGLTTDVQELRWDLQRGTAAEPKQLRVCSLGEEIDYSVAAVTESGGNWLIAPPSGRSALTTTGCIFASGRTIEIRVNTEGFAPGTYAGRLELTPANGARPTNIPVRLTIADRPILSVSRTSMNFQHPLGGETPPPPATIQVTSGGVPAEFTVEWSVRSGINWMRVEPSRATTPATLNVSVDPAGLTIGSYQGAIVIRGPENTLGVVVNFSVFDRIIRTEIRPIPEVARFSWRRGTPSPEPLRIGFAPIVLPVAFATQVDTPPSTWMTAFAIDGPGVPGIGVRVEPTNLADGVYRGSVTIRTTNPEVQADPVRLPVELTVWTTAPALTVTPSSVELVHGGPPVKLAIATGSMSIGYEVSGGQTWLMVGSAALPPLTPRVTPDELTVQPTPGALLPGVYATTIRITAADGRFVDVPVKLTKTTLDLVPAGPPTVGALVNGASQRIGSVSPGAIVTLFGYPLGSGARVFFDGVEARVLYSSPSQANAIVPYEVAGKRFTAVEVRAPDPVPGEANPVFGRSAPQALPVEPVAPALFTLDGSGAGQAAALNQDNSLNGARAPATRGSTIQLFATGEGLLSPPGETGGIAGETLSRPILPVTVSVGGQPAAVLYAGTSPGSVFGLLQINATVPANVNPGNAVPVVLKVGEVESPAGVTIAVR